MTLVLDLPAELQARLEQEAAREGVAPQDYALKALDAALPALPRTGAELLAYWEREDCRGVFNDAQRFPQDAEELARTLRQKASGTRILDTDLKRVLQAEAWLTTAQPYTR